MFTSSSRLALIGLCLAATTVSAQSTPAVRGTEPDPIGGAGLLVTLTRQQVGLKYRYGAKEPGKAFDCSALVQWVAGLFGRDLPRTAALQATTGIEIPKDTAQLLPGDLLMFGKGKRVTHVGIYVGDGRYVHAANRRKGVIESEIARAKPTYWKSVRRIFADSTAMTPDSLAALKPQGS